MAQVVQSKGWVAPLVTMVIGGVLLLNGVPALLQWLPWIAQTAALVDLDYALETALVPLLMAGAATFIGFLMARGGFSALVRQGRGAAQRARGQVRDGVQQVRREAEQRYGDVSSQAQQLVNKVPDGWRERIQAAAQAVEQERAARAVSAAHPEWEGQGARQQAQGQRPQQSQGQPTARPQRAAQEWEQLQQGRPPQGWQQPQQQRPQQQRPQQAPGADRLSRIEELRSRVDSRVQQVAHGQQEAARQAAEQARRAAQAAAARAQQGLPVRLDEATEALVGRLDLADAERVRRRGSSLTRSSLSTSALSKTSLRLNSLLQHRR